MTDRNTYTTEPVPSAIESDAAFIVRFYATSDPSPDDIARATALVGGPPRAEQREPITPPQPTSEPKLTGSDVVALLAQRRAERDTRAKAPPPPPPNLRANLDAIRAIQRKRATEPTTEPPSPTPFVASDEPEPIAGGDQPTPPLDEEDEFFLDHYTSTTLSSRIIIPPISAHNDTSNNDPEKTIPLAKEPESEPALAGMSGLLPDIDHLPEWHPVRCAVIKQVAAINDEAAIYLPPLTALHDLHWQLYDNAAVIAAFDARMIAENNRYEKGPLAGEYKRSSKSRFTLKLEFRVNPGEPKIDVYVNFADSYKWRGTNPAGKISVFLIHDDYAAQEYEMRRKLLNKFNKARRKVNKPVAMIGHFEYNATDHASLGKNKGHAEHGYRGSPAMPYNYAVLVWSDDGRPELALINGYRMTLIDLDYKRGRTDASATKHASAAFEAHGFARRDT